MVSKSENRFSLKSVKIASEGHQILGLELNFRLYDAYKYSCFFYHQGHNHCSQKYEVHQMRFLQTMLKIYFFFFFVYFQIEVSFFIRVSFLNELT